MSAVPAVKFYLTPSVLQNPAHQVAPPPPKPQPGNVCPVCGSGLIEIRQKRVCQKCHTICETCCEGARG